MSIAARTDTRSPAPHVADRHDLILVLGARENNLKNVSMCPRCEGMGSWQCHPGSPAPGHQPYT
jgi:hypothetical protein